MSDQHLEHDDEHWIPDRTYMQATPGDTVEYGYSTKDMDIPKFIGWMSGLLGVTIVSMIVLYGAIRLMQSRVAVNEDVPAMYRIRPIPPKPRLIPNPVDMVPGRPLIDPVEYHAEEKAQEDQELIHLQLLDVETGLAKLPEAAAEKAIEAVNGAQPVEVNGIEMPSDSSGGTNKEDRLR